MIGTNFLVPKVFSMRLLDEYVKRGLWCKHYGRYVDDFYIVGNSSQELLALIPLIKEFLSSHLGLKLHPRKVHLVSVFKVL